MLELGLSSAYCTEALARALEFKDAHVRAYNVALWRARLELALVRERAQARA